MELNVYRVLVHRTSEQFVAASSADAAREIVSARRLCFEDNCGIPDTIESVELLKWGDKE